MCVWVCYSVNCKGFYSRAEQMLRVAKTNRAFREKNDLYSQPYQRAVPSGAGIVRVRHTPSVRMHVVAHRKSPTTVSTVGQINNCSTRLHTGVRERRLSARESACVKDQVTFLYHIKLRNSSPDSA